MREVGASLMNPSAGMRTSVTESSRRRPQLEGASRAGRELCRSGCGRRDNGGCGKPLRFTKPARSAASPNPTGALLASRVDDAAANVSAARKTEGAPLHQGRRGGSRRATRSRATRQLMVLSGLLVVQLALALLVLAIGVSESGEFPPFYGLDKDPRDLF